MKLGKSEVEVKKLRDANQYLKQWLFEHIDNPYPTVDEKKRLMEVTNLNRKRIDAWFKNARHRYMCSASKVVNPNYSRYPSQVTKMLVDWLIESSSSAHRYPNKQEEENLLKQTNLTKVQLRRWFSNARKRGLLARIKQKQFNKLTGESLTSQVTSAPSLQDAYSNQTKLIQPQMFKLETPSQRQSSIQMYPHLHPNPYVFMHLGANGLNPQSLSYPVQFPSVYQPNLVSPAFQLAPGMCNNVY